MVPHLAYMTKYTREQMSGHSNPTINMDNRKPTNKGGRKDEWNKGNKKAEERRSRRRNNTPTGSGHKMPGSLKAKKGGGASSRYS